MKKIITTSIILSSLLMAGPIHDLMDNRIKGKSYSGSLDDHSAAEDGLGILPLQHHSGTSTINNELLVQKVLAKINKSETDKTKRVNIKDSLTNGSVGTSSDLTLFNKYISASSSSSSVDLSNIIPSNLIVTDGWVDKANWVGGNASWPFGSAGDIPSTGKTTITITMKDDASSGSVGLFVYMFGTKNGNQYGDYNFVTKPVIGSGNYVTFDVIYDNGVMSINSPSGLLYSSMSPAAWLSGGSFTNAGIPDENSVFLQIGDSNSSGDAPSFKIIDWKYDPSSASNADLKDPSSSSVAITSTATPIGSQTLSTEFSINNTTGWDTIAEASDLYLVALNKDSANVTFYALFKGVQTGITIPVADRYNLSINGSNNTITINNQTFGTSVIYGGGWGNDPRIMRLGNGYYGPLDGKIFSYSLK